MTVVVGFIVPVRTKNESNSGQGHHWKITQRKRKAVRGKTLLCARAALMPPPKPPLVVMMTRFSAGELDDDGLRSALKSVRDGIADWLGVDDKRADLVRYGYGQEPCKRGQGWVAVEVSDMAMAEQILNNVEPAFRKIAEENGLVVERDELGRLFVSCARKVG